MQLDSNRLRFWTEDPTTTLIVAGIMAVFFGWRLFGGGTFGKEDILAAIEQEYIEEYRYRLYEKAKAEDEVEEVEGNIEPSEYWRQMGGEIDVSFKNVAVAAPLLSWKANEEVIINFDYKLTHNGETVNSEEDRYVRVSRPGNITYPSGPIAFYVNKFL